MTALLEVRDLARHFSDKRGIAIRALDGVSFTVAANEVLGIVGESGSGKSTLARTLMRLNAPTSGYVRLDGQDFATLSGTDLKAARKKMQMVFQDPFGSLNPRHTVGYVVAEPLIVHGVARRPALQQAGTLLDLVGLSATAAGRYPHEFSGGQRQRIAIARALALEPRLIIADEPVSALDVSIQSQILNLITELRARLGLAMIFISHDLSVIRHVSDRVAVMYFGRIVEMASTETLFARPKHPYTQALLSVALRGKANKDAGRIILAGEMPDPANPPPGCAFYSRCPKAADVCRREKPALVSVGTAHSAACLRL